MNTIIKLSKLEIPCFEELKMGEMNQLRINIIKLKLYCFNFLILNFNCLYKSIDNLPSFHFESSIRIHPFSCLSRHFRKLCTGWFVFCNPNLFKL